MKDFKIEPDKKPKPKSLEAEGYLQIEVFVQCPNCGEAFDLMDFNRLSLTEYMHKNYIGIENYNKNCMCPGCHKMLRVKKIVS